MVSSEINKTGPYACNGATTEFSFPYKIFAVTDLKVYLRDTDDELTLLTYTTHYSIASINGQDYNDGVTVTTVATYAEGNTITILRVVPLTQGADYVENDDFPAEGHESALDRGVMISQQLNEQSTRVMSVPVDEEGGIDMILPGAGEREGGFLGFKAGTGEPIAASALNNDDIPVTAYAETLLDDETSAEALGTLEIPTELQGMSAFIKTLLDDANAETARNTLGAYQKIVAKSGDYTITDTDNVSVIDMTTGAADKTATLPTAADNIDRELTLRKADDGVGKAILDGEGAETINGTTTWEVTEQYGHVTVKSNGTTWVVIGHEGCIYEQWQISDVALADNTNWQECFNLASVPPGKYEIEFFGVLRIGNSLGKYKYMTLSNATATEENDKYTCYVRLGGQDVTEGHSLFIKRFIRDLASTTTLYLNARKTMADANFQLQAAAAEAYIRATRMG